MPDEVRKLTDARVAVACTYDPQMNRYETYRETDIDKLSLELESTDIIVGFNINRFDFAVLARYFDTSNFKLKSIDVFELLKKEGYTLKLNQIAIPTVGTGKTTLGQAVPIMWRLGEEARVIRHCRRDAFLSWAIYDFGINNGFVFAEIEGRLEQIDVDWREVYRDSLFAVVESG